MTVNILLVLLSIFSLSLRSMPSDEAVFDASGTVDVYYELSKLSVGFKLSPASVDARVDWLC